MPKGRSWLTTKKETFHKPGPVATEQELLEDMDRVPTVTTMKVAGGKATDMRVAGQNTSQPGTGLLAGRNFLGRRVT